MPLSLPQIRNHDLSVNPVTGGMMLHAVDLVIPCRGGAITFERWHNSLRVFPDGGNLFWFDEKLKFDEDGAIRHILPEGGEFRFVRTLLDWVPSSPMNHEKLEEVGERFVVTFKDGRRHIFRNSIDGRMTSMVDTCGNTIQLSWTEGGQYLTKIQDPVGRTITMTVDGTVSEEPSTWRFTDWSGRTWEYGWRSTTAFEYYKDPMGNVTTYGNHETPNRPNPTFEGVWFIDLPDTTRWMTVSAPGPSPQANKVARIEFANGLIVSWNYLWDDNKTTVLWGEAGANPETLPAENFEYDESLNVTRYIDPIGNEWTYEYENHLVTQITDPLLAVTTQEWDSMGNLISRTNALTNTWTYTYDPVFNKVATITDPSPFNYVTEYEYDPVTGLLLTWTNKQSKDTTYEYDTHGQLVQVTDPNSNTVQYSWDAVGNCVATTDGRGKVTRNIFDSVGNPIRTIDQLGRTTSRRFDANNNLLAATNPLGNTTSFVFDTRQLLVTVLDALGRGTQYSYGRMEELSSVHNAIGAIVEYSYDRNLNLTRVRNANSQIWLFEYDRIDRMVRQTDPLGRITSWDYDPYCNSFTRIDANGRRTKTHRDVICQVTRVEYNDGSFVAFTLDELGRLTRMTQPGTRFGEQKYGAFLYGTNPNDDIIYDYDEMDRLLSVTYPGSKVVGFEYDDGGRLHILTDVDNTNTTYDYYSNDVINTATRDGKTVTYDLDDGSQVVSEALSNGIICLYTYDDAGQITAMNYTLSDDPVLSLAYVYDLAGNRTRKSVSRGADPPISRDYAYDAINRLVANTGDESFVYDLNGNILARILDGLTILSTVDAADELTTQGTVAFDWTPVGELATRRDASNGYTTYRFGYQGLLEQAVFPDESSSSYRYFGSSPLNGLRKWKVDNEGIQTQHVWVPSGLPAIINELDDIGATISSYFLAGGFAPAGIITADTHHWFLTDAQGSVLALADDYGEITDTYDYSAFGTQTATSGSNYNPIRFTAQYYDSESKLVYMRARYLDTYMQRFINKDPYFDSIISDWSSTDFSFESSFAYVGNMPTRFVDPEGLQMPGQIPNYRDIENPRRPVPENTPPPPSRPTPHPKPSRRPPPRPSPCPTPSTRWTDWLNPGPF